MNLQDLVIQLASMYGMFFSPRRLFIALTGIFPTSGGILVCIFSYTACITLKSLKDDVKNCSKWGEIQIGKTKRHYALVCQFVEEIDKCFGAVYLILITSTFIRTINNTFYSLVYYQRDRQMNSFTSLLYIVKDLLIFATFIYIAHKIRREVTFNNNNSKRNMLLYKLRKEACCTIHTFEL